MRSCDDPKLIQEQIQLFEQWLEKYKDIEYPDEEPLEFAYTHGSKELIAYFEKRERQLAWDKMHGCITN